LVLLKIKDITERYRLAEFIVPDGKSWLLKLLAPQARRRAIAAQLPPKVAAQLALALAA
jgi:hypothetical protein